MLESLVWAATDVTTDTIPICPHETATGRSTSLKIVLQNILFNIC